MGEGGRRIETTGGTMRVTRRTVLQTSLLGAAGMLRTTAIMAQSPPPGPAPAERERLAHLAADLMDWCEAPGLSVAIAMKGEPVYVEAFGFADKEKQETLTTQHRFRIASVTKPITSAGILLLMQDGKLRLTDHVFGPDSILGDEYKTPPGRQDIENITVEHLLTHTSGGWPNNHDDPMFKNKQMNHQELIKYALEDQPLTAEPGRHYAYSNFGYCLLGRVIEKTTNQKYDRYIISTLLAPSGISDMQIAGNTLAERAVNEVKYYSQVPGQDPYDLNVERMDSHGGWIAAPIDLVRFTASIDGSRGAPLLSPETLKIMTTPSQANLGYAKGLFVNSVHNYWHTGSLPGTATVAVRTHTDFCWAAFVNTRTKFEDMLDSLDALMWHMVGSVDGWRA
jgi:CubicO group peptidase (beta-lactamase class C family)